MVVRHPGLLSGGITLAAIGSLLLAGPAGCGKTYPSPAGMSADSAFAAVVVPVLRDQCQGCHFPGQPMHGELPFDDPAVVRELGDGVAVLLEGQGRERVREWLALVRADTVGRVP